MIDRIKRSQSGLDLFGNELDPRAVEGIRGWADHAELQELQAALQAHTDRTPFFDTYAEALVARHLLRHDCTLRFEVPTPNGKRCDFEVRHGEHLLYVHVKRVHSDRDKPTRLTISPRLRYLERIERPYIVSVRWHDGLSDDLMHRFVSRAAEFIGQARVGDELTVRNDKGGTNGQGQELGGVRIIAPWRGSHVSLVLGLPSGFTDESPRIRKLLTRAYRQFMPKAMNVILICSMNSDDVQDFQNALLGSHIERWDAVPPRGRRVAHGRAADGFWHGGRYAESVAVGWFAFSAADDAIALRLWQRKGVIVEPQMQDVLGELFGEHATDDHRED